MCAIVKYFTTPPARLPGGSTGRRPRCNQPRSALTPIHGLAPRSAARRAKANPRHGAVTVQPHVHEYVITNSTVSKDQHLACERCVTIRPGEGVHVKHGEI